MQLGSAVPACLNVKVTRVAAADVGHRDLGEQRGRLLRRRRRAARSSRCSGTAGRSWSCTDVDGGLVGRRARGRGCRRRRKTVVRRRSTSKPASCRCRTPRARAPGKPAGCTSRRMRASWHRRSRAGDHRYDPAHSSPHSVEELTLGTIADHDVVIVEAARSPLGRRNGGLATVHPVDLLATVQRTVIERSGIDPALVGQVIGGCVSQVGEQTFNIARNAWLSAGLPLEVAGTTVDAQCGSSQQATNLAAALVEVGRGRRRARVRRRVDEPVPLGAATRGEFGRPTTAVVPRALRAHVAVRGRGAHRRQVGHHPRRCRPVRPRVAGARATGVGRGPLRTRGRADRRARRRRGRQADRARRTTSPATKACARRRSRRSRS